MKKNLMIALSMVLVAVIAVAGTLAFLKDDDSVVNTFTVGKVDITLDEADVNTAGEKESEDRVKENDYHLLPGHEYIKDPTVTVLDKSEESFIRVLVTVNKKAALDAIFKDGLDLTTIFGGYDAAKWLYESCTVKDDTRVYEFRYFETVGAPNGDVKLAPIFKTITLPGTIEGPALSSLEGLQISVVAQAIQADGFGGDADKAWEAFG